MFECGLIYPNFFYTIHHFQHRADQHLISGRRLTYDNVIMVAFNIEYSITSPNLFDENAPSTKIDFITHTGIEEQTSHITQSC